MITCDMCGKQKDVATRRFVNGGCVIASLKTDDGKSSESIYLWRGDACKECFQRLAEYLKSSLANRPSQVPAQ